MIKREVYSSLFLTFCLFILVGKTKAEVNWTDHESNIVLYGFKDSIDNSFIVTLDESIEDYGCGPKDNVSIIIHGYMEGLNTSGWINETTVKLLKHANGCVFVFDYSVYSKNYNYFSLINQYERIAEVLTKYLLLIGHPERIFIFGFSLGARLSVESGIAAYNGSIARIDLCDAAKPGFDGSARAKDPTLAAKNVACIAVSNNYGTTVFNCHQNFRMGNCGYSQAGHNLIPRWGSHGLCPAFYNAAFDYDFIPFNDYGCSSTRLANLTEGVKMGYLGTFNRTEVRGDIFVSTAAREPFVAVATKEVVKSLNDLYNLVKLFAQRQYQIRNDKGDAVMYKLRSDMRNATEIALGDLDLFFKTLDKSYPVEFLWDRD